MAARKHGDPAALRKNTSTPPNWTRATDEPPANSARPLSDIREVTEISLMDGVLGRARLDPAQSSGGIKRQSSLKRSGSFKRGDPTSIKRNNSVKIVEPERQRKRPSTSSSDHEQPPTPEPSSVYSAPPSSIPRRTSSKTKRPHENEDRHIDGSFERSSGESVRGHGESISPLKVAGLHRTSTGSETSQRLPARTFLRSPAPIDVLEFPTCRHARIDLDIHVIAPLFVGGGSVEGYVRTTVDEADKTRQRKEIYVSAMAVDLLGVEELIGQNRKAIFLSLATELLDKRNPPPREMILPTAVPSAREGLWVLRPTSTMLPFRINLPLDVGPTPFRSKTAQIRYMLCVTMIVRDSGRHYTIRSSQNVTVVSTYDPERALRSLPSPLTAYDEIAMPKAGELDRIRLTAGLHRQVWVSGTSIFVDVHIANDARKTLKKLELAVERDILCYKHAAAATLQQSAGQARIFQDREQTILSKAVLKPGANGWIGVKPYTSLVRTCEVDIPRGHSTVRCGKFFEVRFFLNITAGTSHTKLVSVQLPIILIHMNSLDVLPNAVNQVAVAIEEKRQKHKRSHSHKTSDPDRERDPGGHIRTRSTQTVHERHTNHRDPPRIQGRAFAAPRQQSLDRARAHAAEIDDIGQVINNSPRKYKPESKVSRKVSTTQNRKTNDRPRLKKTPSSASLGAYTLFNQSNASFDVQYETPMPGHSRRAKAFEAGADTVKDRLRSIRSFDTLRNRSKSRGRHAPREDTKQKHRPDDPDSVLDYYLDGHASSPSSRSSPGKFGRGRSPRPKETPPKPSSKGKQRADPDDLETRSKSKPHQQGAVSMQPTMLGLSATTNHNLLLQPPSPTRARHIKTNSRSTDTAASATDYRADIVTSAQGYSIPQRPSHTRSGSSGAGNVVRRASLKLKESVEKIERGRFEFRPVGHGVKKSESDAPESGWGSAVGVVKGWLGRERSRGAKERFRNRDQQREREGWI